ncbi:MAG TPA: hypothetical protein VKC54_01640 [Patescibacteria group bacterium]|nr:hypothetical protein [Patescibacteria group bacterium]
MTEYEKRSVATRNSEYNYLTDFITEAAKPESYIPLSDGMLENFEKVKLFTRSYFSQFGIDNLAEPRIFQIEAQNFGERKDKAYAFSVPGSIVVRSEPNQPTKEMGEFQQTRSMLKEYYHTTTTWYYNFNNNGIPIKPDRRGICYATAGLPAFEEGLGWIFLSRAKSFLHELFPNSEFQHYFNVGLLVCAVKEMPEITRRLYISNPDQVESLSIVPLSSLVDSNEPVKFSIPEFAIHSLMLTNYIIEQIPNFFQLVERARMADETLPFARAMCKRFGMQLYKRIVTVGLLDADSVAELLHYLKKY